MSAPVNIPITPELLNSVGFERVTDCPNMHFVMEDVELHLADDGKIAFWKGHSLVLHCWEEFLQYYRFVKGHDFDSAVGPVREFIEYQWQ